MRIGINAAFIGNRYSGTGTYTIGMAGCLAELGHEVVVYTGSSLFQSHIGIQFRRTPACLAFERGSIASAFRFLWNQSTFPFHIRREGLDLVFSQNADGTFWSSVPQVLVIHDIIPLLYPEESPRLHLYYKSILPVVLPRIKALIAVSQTTKDYVVDSYQVVPSKIQIVYDGVNHCCDGRRIGRKPLDLNCAHFFLFVGTFSPRKNLSTVLDALARAKLDVPESLVVVAYPDRWMEATLKKVEDLGICDRVIFLRGPGQEELTYLYQHATALFLLSECEGFGLPPVEAMSSGTPAVVSDSGALAEVAGDAAIKVKSHDVDATAEVMRSLSHDKEFRDQWRERGLKRSELFRWDRTRAQLQEVLRQFS